MAQHELDELDEKILNLIVGNARIPFLEVARECAVSGAAIHQRVQKLTNIGVIKGSEFIVDSEKIGYETCAFIGIYLTSPSTSIMLCRSWREYRRWWNVIIPPGSMIC